MAHVSIYRTCRCSPCSARGRTTRYPRINPLCSTVTTYTPELKKYRPQKSTSDHNRTRGFRHKEPQIGRSSDNRRFCSPNYKRLAALPNRIAVIKRPLTLFVLPLAPASLARSAHLAPLTTLHPRWGLALFDYARLLYRRLFCSLGNYPYSFSPCIRARRIFSQTKLLQVPKAFVRSELRIEKP